MTDADCAPSTASASARLEASRAVSLAASDSLQHEPPTNHVTPRDQLHDQLHDQPRGLRAAGGGAVQRASNSGGQTRGSTDQSGGPSEVHEGNGHPGTSVDQQGSAVAVGEDSRRSPVNSSADFAPHFAPPRGRRTGNENQEENRWQRAGTGRSDCTRREKKWNGQKRGRSKPAVPKSMEVAQDGQRCSICSQPWHRNGTHQVCSLPCGHLFGRCCIEEELKRRVASKRELSQCPVCRTTALRTHIRLIYATNEAQGDAQQRERRSG